MGASRHRFGFAFVILLLVGCSGPSAPPTSAPVLPTRSPTPPAGLSSPPPAPLAVTYLFSAETAYERIEINQARLAYTTFEDVDDRCAQWIEQSPCWSEADLRTREAPLSEGELRDLADFIRQAGFLGLEDSYGGAQPGQRYYPYRLSVVMGATGKEVTYQSYPGAPAMPGAFKAVVDRLYELVDAKMR